MKKACKFCTAVFETGNASKFCSARCRRNYAVSRMVKRNEKGSTLCWDCAKAVKKCSWSRAFKPVKGWEATPSRLKIGNGKTVDSYIVHKCPEYVSDREERENGMF